MSQFNLIFILASIRTKFSATEDCCGLLKICHGVATALFQNRAIAIWNANIKTTNSSPAQAQARYESIISRARFDQYHISP